MKRKKTLFKKFHRKYAFLQNSLVHFLDWRVSDFSNLMTLTTHSDQPKYLFSLASQSERKEKNKKNTFHFLEQEKICFQDYWKNSEHKKIENAIQNMNKELIKSKNIFYFQKSLNSSKKRSVLNIQKKSFTVQQKFAKSQASIPINKKNYFKSLEKSKLLSSSSLDTFIPKSDFFHRRNLFFLNQKIGEFFPEKKNFTQYWIFPLLGFVVFFSSKPTFFETRFKKVFEYSLGCTSENHSLNVHKQPILSKKSFTFVPIFSYWLSPQAPAQFSSSFFPMDLKSTPNNFSLHKKMKQQNLNFPFVDFSYTNVFSKETYNQMKNLEKDEFEKFCNFSFKIFQNSPNFFLLDLINSSTSTHQKEFHSLFSLYNKNCLKKHIYRKIIETKRNSFHWKWFSLNAESLHFPILVEQKNKASDYSFFDSPLAPRIACFARVAKRARKAQFFSPLFEKNSLFDFSKLQTLYNFSNNLNLYSSQQSFQKNFTLNQKKISLQTPLYNYSKTMFLFNEFERNLNNIFHMGFSNKKEYLSFLNNIVSLSNANTEKSNFDVKTKKDFFEFTNNSSFFDIKTLEKHTKHFINNDKKNAHYLMKWLQTQNFWKVHKNSSSFKFLPDFSNLKKNTVQNLQNSVKISEKNINMENLMYLDFIFFRKLFSSLSSPKKDFKKKTLKTVNILSNFSKFMYNKKVYSDKIHSNRIFSNLKTPFPFVLKKQTFKFFIFQHYKQNSKKSINNFFTKASKNDQQKNKMKHKDSARFACFASLASLRERSKREKQKPKNLLPSLTNRFRQNSLKCENKNEKIILKNFENFSKIKTLKIPIYMDFYHQQMQAKKSFSKLDIYSQKQKRIFSQNQNTFPFFYSSKDENLEARPSNLSSIYFHLFHEKKISSINLNHLSLKKFLKSKKNFVQTSYEKTLTTLKKNNFFSFSILQLESFTFQNHYLFEKIKKEKPFIFQNHENFSSLMFFSPSLNKKQSLFKSAKFFVLKEKKALCFTTHTPSTASSTGAKPFSFTTAPKTQFFKNYFQNFTSKKYEKIFKTFLTPLNKEKVLSANFSSVDREKQKFKELSFFDKKTSNFSKLDKDKKVFSKIKTSKDIFILQNLYPSVQENIMYSHSPFFIPLKKKQTLQHTISTTVKNSSSNIKKNTNLFSPQFKEYSHRSAEKTQENLKNQNFKKLFSNRTTNVLYPSFILKRDGFVFFPSFRPFDVSETKTQQKSTSFDFQTQKRDTTSTLKRLQQEKLFQKKRRMKKQKLETRRRKKRKRFFPRPVWLRFHLYKKFLKTRHPHLWQNYSVSSENRNKKGLIVSKKLSFAPQNVFVLVQKKSKYQNIKAFSTKKTNSFIFRFSNAKKWKTILYSPFLKSTLCFQQAVPMQALLRNVEKNIFQNQNKDQNISTVFKYFNKNSLFNSLKKKNYAFQIGSLKNYNEFSGNKIYRKNRQNWGFSWKKKFLASSEKHFYKKFESRINFFNQTNFMNKLSPISENLDHYKISGEILSEFIRLSWKSYWFLTNFQPYTKQITQNFRKMQKIESERNFSNYLTTLSNKKSPILFQNLPIFQNNFSHNSIDLLLRNSVFRKFSWYCNVKNSLEENSVLGNPLNQLSQKSINYQNIQNFPEYNRILYSRISEILRNFKSLENTDDQFMSIQNQKKFNFPKRKNENISSNSSFFTKNAVFFENFQIPSQPSIPAFSIFSSIFNDFSIKPTGEMPTLRSLWALHQTNFYHFQEKNAVRHLWTIKKRTDSLKSFKGTKKAVHFFRKYSGLEKLNSPQLLEQFTSKDFLLSSKKDEFFQQENFIGDKKIYPLVKKSNSLIFLNFTNKKMFLFSNLKSNFHNFVQQLDKMSFQKFLNNEKKCSLFGIHTIQQHSKLSLRFLKFHLFSKTSQKNFFKPSVHSAGTGTPLSDAARAEQLSKPFNRQNIEQLESSYVFKNKNLNQQNSSKSLLNFWWSQKNYTIFDFFMSSQSTKFNSLQFIPFFSLEVYSNTLNKKTLQHTEHIDLESKNDYSANLSLLFSRMEFNGKNKSTSFSTHGQILWFGAILFHLSLFFTILKLPEIRSVLKFQCVLFSKFFAGFFFIVFSLYNSFKKYTKKGTFVANKILSNTSFVKKTKAFDVFPFDLEHSSEFQNFISSRNKHLQKKNLINLLFYFENFQKSSFLHLNNTFTSKKSLSKNFYFELFVRLSKFSLLFSKNQSLKNSKKYKNLNVFFVSIHNFYSIKNLKSLKKIAENKISNTKNFIKIYSNLLIPIEQKFPMTFLKNSKSIFHFQNSFKQIEKKNKRNWKNSLFHDFLLSFYSYEQIRFTTLPMKLKTFYTLSNSNEFLKQKFVFSKSKQKLNSAWQKMVRDHKTTAKKDSKNTLFIFNKKLMVSSTTPLSGRSLGGDAFKNKLPENKFLAQPLQQKFKKIQTLSLNEKFICHLALSFLFIGKSTTLLTSNIVQFGTNVSSKIFDFVETIMFSIYKFLEKPAEVLIEWIAFVFLIEWSSDIATFVPDTLDIALTKSFQKLHRPVRSGSFFLSFLNSRNENMFFYFSPYLSSNFPGSFTNFFGYWSYVNLTSFILQKRIMYFFENFCTTLLQPDMDILTRQRKGILFWDIWAEILLKAAEKYNVNIPSFVTLKEEQELFIEKLLQDKEFLKNLQTQTQQDQTVLFLRSLLALIVQVSFVKKKAVPDNQQRKTLNAENLEQNSLSSFIENFIEKERFQQFYEYNSVIESKNLTKKKQNIEQLNISDFIFSQSVKNNSSFLTNQQRFYTHLFELFCSKMPICWTDKQLEVGNEIASSKYSVTTLLQPKQNVDLTTSGQLVHLLNARAAGSTLRYEAHNVQANQQKLFMLFSQPIFIDSFSSGADFYSSSSASGAKKFDRSSSYGGNQFGTYQGPETDLFIDIHPPKSLKHILFSKYYEPAQFTLGSLICQVYSGLFSKQISKNILVIGAPGTAKTLFIQALAGETEMKMITDNAYRYSMVLRGVAVGMKNLRDVFDALALQTPCFFLMEHIHVLGSKRPFLISDDENIKGKGANVGLEQQEVHETNQMIYQLNRHSIVDYKRPYKGDFSMGIPTNFFVQRFYSNSEKNSNSIFLSSGPTSSIKNSIFSVGGVSAQNRNPISPLPVDSIEHSLVKQGFAEKEKTDNAFQNSENNSKQNSKSQSRLQTVQEQIFAPPATSPFTILMMKEQKKLKPKKRVQENPWGGLSADQFISYQKESSSVRAKVALLADITMNLSRGKLDMITDLLVIIDSVRSNRGFVVFATTHLPSLLDPALRRPGRFDETISLAQSPNFLNRFEILKTNFQNSLTTLDFLDSSIYTENLSEMNLLNFIMGTKLCFFHQYKYTSFQKNFLQNTVENKKLRTNQSHMQLADQKSTGHLLKLHKLDKFIFDKGNKVQQRLVSQLYPTKAFHSFLKSSLFFDLYSKKAKTRFENSKQNFNSKSSAWTSSSQLVDSTSFFSTQVKKEAKFTSLFFLRNLKLLKYTILPKAPSHILNFAYSKIGIFLAQSNLLQDPAAFTPLSLDIDSNFAYSTQKNREFLGNVLYGSQQQQKLQIMIFLAGKVAEFCLQKNTFSSITKNIETFYSKISSRKNFSLNTSETLNKPSSLFYKKYSLFPTSFDWQNENIFEEKQSHIKRVDSVAQYQQKNLKNIGLFKNQSHPLFVPKCAIQWTNNKKHLFSIDKKASSLQKTDFYWTTFGNNQIWRFITPFLFSIIQKRYLFTKNLLLSKMLFFDNKNTRKQPPSPPSSSILMPSRKFENFKRTENDFVQKSRFSINEKIQMHQQQRFLKILYNIPLQQYFRSEMIENRTTLFSSSFQELAYLDSLTRKFSSSHFYQRKYLVIRHRFSNTNQWWNGLLAEHNTETTFLSDVDWRTMFGTTSKQKSSFLLMSDINNSLKQNSFSKEKISRNKNSDLFVEKDKNQTFEFVMDFPDAEQYYNPRNRRWYFNSHFRSQLSDSLQMSSDFKKKPFVWQNQKTVVSNEVYNTKNVSINSFDIHESSSYWFTFDKTLQYEIYYHFLMQSFHETFKYFNSNREMLDLFVFILLKKGFLKELDFLMTVSRF